jgi:metal-dependent amidase/aminoacylase/carboxypeptidase family protein
MSDEKQPLGGFFSTAPLRTDKLFETVCTDACSKQAGARTTHGAYPWAGVDPITVAAQIILGLQTDPRAVPTNHSPYFFADEGALPVGVRALTHLTIDYMMSRPGAN